MDEVSFRFSFMSQETAWMYQWLLSQFPSLAKDAVQHLADSLSRQARPDYEKETRDAAEWLRSRIYENVHRHVDQHRDTLLGFGNYIIAKVDYADWYRIMLALASSQESDEELVILHDWSRLGGLAFSLTKHLHEDYSQDDQSQE